MDPIKTRKLPRDAIGDFIPTPRGIRAFEDLQGDASNLYEALTNASFLTLTNEPSLGSERVLTLSADLEGSDGGANSTYTLGLSDTTVVAGTYGAANKTVSIIVDAKGRMAGAAEYALNTSNITEGANLFFTNARARSALSGGTGISYNSGTGVISLDNTITSGTYTPTLANANNLTSSSAAVCQYMRLGDVVTVSGSVTMQPTTGATLTRLGLSLPIASNFAGSSQCGGTANTPGVAGQSAGIYSDATNHEARIEFISSSTSNETFTFSFTYLIV